MPFRKSRFLRGFFFLIPFSQFELILQFAFLEVALISLGFIFFYFNITETKNIVILVTLLVSTESSFSLKMHQ